MIERKTWIGVMILVLGVFLFAACEDSDNSSSDGDKVQTDGDKEQLDGDQETESNIDVGKVLNSLGVDMQDETPITPGTHPLGHQNKTLTPLNELVVAGFGINDKPVTILDDGLADFDKLYEENDPSTNMEGLKRGISGDLDGDGYDEIVLMVYSRNDEKLHFLIYDDKMHNFAVLTNTLTLDWPILANKSLNFYLDMAVGDFDNDSKSEILIAASYEGIQEIEADGDQEAEAKDLTEGSIWVLDDAGENFKSLFYNAYTDSKRLFIAAGELSGDLNDEFVVSIHGKGDVNTFEVWSFGETGFARLESDTVEWQDDKGNLLIGKNSDVAIGDMDADGVGEIIFGGNLKGDSRARFGLVLDDIPHEYKVLGGMWNLPNPMTSASDPLVEVVDFDRDYKPEIYFDGDVYYNFTEKDDPWTLRFKNPFSLSGSQSLKMGTYSVAVGDFTGDGREDFAFILSVNLIADPVIHIYGLKQTGEMDQLKQVKPDKAKSNVFPILVAANVDDDSAIISYTGDYKYVFTEPIVLAALASPPCKDGIGQNLSQCFTTFGTAKSETITTENSFTFKAGVIVGTSVEDRLFTQSAIEVEAKVTAAITFKSSVSFSKEVTVAYSTGDREDGVVFLTVPYDVYTYTIVSHPVPQMVGQTTQVSIPRKPIVLIAERSFYNKSVEDETLQIGSEVFKHTLEDISSYPTKSDKDDLIDEFGGMESQEVSVGQGAGFSEISIEVSKEFGVGMALGIEFEFTAKTTVAGVTLGFQVGMEMESSLMISAGESTIFGSSVGSIDAEHFPSNQFSYGLFSYPFRGRSGQQFYVVNYWVDKKN